MKIRIKKIAPVQAGKMLAVIYGLLSLVFTPIFILVSLFAPKENGIPMLFAVLVPVIYSLVGFIGGIIGALLYNLVASWMGGIEITFEGEPAGPIAEPPHLGSAPA